MLTWTELEHMSPLKKDYSKMIGNDRRKPLRMINSSVPVSSSQSCTNTDIKQLNARFQGWLGVVPSKAPWATLSWLQLLSLSTEKGQVPFGTSVGIVSFFTTLVTGDLLQRPGSPVACTAVLTLHDPDDLWGSLCWRLCLLRQWGLLGGSHRQFKSRVHEFTRGSLWAESHEVIHTDDSPCVPMPTQGTMLAETTVVPRAVLDLRFGIDVQEGTLLIAALPEF